MNTNQPTSQQSTLPTEPPSTPPAPTLTFARRERRKTLWIEGEYPVLADGSDMRPAALFADLATNGWVLDRAVDSIPAFPASTYDPSRPLGQRMVHHDHEVKSFVLSKPGTGMFGDWSDDEARQFSREARTILRSHGYTRVPTWVKTLADML